MSKAREKVQQSGFWDPEVKESAHDAICMWAYRNAEVILRHVYPERFDCEWDIHRDAVGTPNAWDRLENFEVLRERFTAATPRPNPRIFERTFEAVLTAYSGTQGRYEQRVGFADLLISAQNPQIRAVGDYNDANRGFEGFEIDWGLSWSVLVEAKSVLPTLGELMRQIQHYRTAHRGPVVIIAPDDKYAEILKEQGVWFLIFAP